MLWPTILLTAALANSFYVFSVEKRTFFKLAAVYYPIVYLIFLLEFWLLTKKSAQKKVSEMFPMILVPVKVPTPNPIVMTGNDGGDGKSLDMTDGDDGKSLDMTDGDDGK